MGLQITLFNIMNKLGRKKKRDMEVLEDAVMFRNFSRYEEAEEEEGKSEILRIWMSADPADDAPSSPIPSPLTPLPEPHLARNPPPHIPSRSRPVALSPPMSKLEFPKLSDNPSSVVINGWLGRCEDTYEAWQALNPEKSMTPRILITLAGLCMEETWSWSEFATKVKDCFVPSNWGMLALSVFYSIQQGTSSFPDFAKSLQNVRNALAGAGTGYTINDSILKNHLLFHSHPILCLRVSGQQNLPFDTMKVDVLIATMSLTWASLLAEGIIKPLRPPSAVPTASSTSLPIPTPLVSLSSATPASLTQSEKDALHTGLGRTPQQQLPGDPACGIPPRSVPASVAAVSSAGFSSMYGTAVTAVLPAYDPDEDSFSSFSTGDR
ncbi:hypothetical protein B0H14DRAFT_3449259 [Mycena olivaceomarginata]|nr:hypothetical protein B0H14DRAFT_3449259 [Mycena olivaceomarginata]